MAASPKVAGSVILARWNAERQLERAIKSRSHKAMRAPGFAAASIDRLNASLSHWSGSINADLDRGITILRAGGRRLAANTQHGKRFLSLAATNVVGSGPTLQVRAKKANRVDLDKPANDAIEEHWARWGKVADVAGKMTLPHMLRVLIKGIARDGEALLRVVRNRKLAYGMALQLLDSDRLDETINKILDNGNMIRQGVEVDSTLRPIAYHIKSAHPGESYQAQPRMRVERVLARDIFHVFIQERAEQVRGYTWFHAVLRESDMRYGYKEAAMVAARVGASKMGVFTRADEGVEPGLETVADGIDAEGVLQMNGEPGEFIEAPPGYTFNSWDPDYPHENFESFLNVCTRDIAAGLDVATHNLSGDMTDVNYSSARIAELSEREFWMLVQDWLHDTLCVPLYQDWLGSALLMNQITMLESDLPLPAERYEKFKGVSRFQGRRWQWVDPEKEFKAHAVAIKEGLTSRTRICAAMGVEFEDLIDELSQEQAYAEGKGVKLGAPAPAPGALPADDAGDEPAGDKKKPPKPAK